MQPGCKSICHPDEGHAPDCPNQPRRGGSRPPTWDLATVAQVEALLSEVAELREDMASESVLRGDLGRIDVRLSGIESRLAALEARWEAEEAGEIKVVMNHAPATEQEAVDAPGRLQR